MDKMPRPLARATDLKIQTVVDETLVYDTRTDKAYVLSASAAAVWRACNGTRSVQEIAAYLSSESPTDEQTVWYALGQLQPLLQETVSVPHELQRISRRQFLQRAGIVAAATLPVVVSIVAPTPAHAQSGTSFCCVCEPGWLLPVKTCDAASCGALCTTYGEQMIGCYDAETCIP